MAADPKRIVNTELRVRVTPELKARATEALADCGLDVSGAIRLFLAKVISEGGLPFALKTPNAKTIAAMEEARDVVAKRVRR